LRSSIGSWGGEPRDGCARRSTGESDANEIGAFLDQGEVQPGPDHLTEHPFNSSTGLLGQSQVPGCASEHWMARRRRIREDVCARHAADERARRDRDEGRGRVLYVDGLAQSVVTMDRSVRQGLSHSYLREVDNLDLLSVRERHWRDASAGPDHVQSAPERCHEGGMKSLNRDGLTRRCGPVLVQDARLSWLVLATEQHLGGTEQATLFIDDAEGAQQIIVTQLGER
jgi:hypothetical protein